MKFSRLFSLTIRTSILATMFSVFAMQNDIASACESVKNAEAAQVRSLVAEIETKFGLTSKFLEYQCGGSSIQFSFRPPIAVAEVGGRLQPWNDSFPIGTISGDTSLVMLKSILALDKAVVEFLKRSRAYIVRDFVRLNENGIDFGLYPQRFEKYGAISKVYAPQCDAAGFGYLSSAELVEVVLPISTLEGMFNSPDANMYEAGDIVSILSADENFKLVFAGVSKSNFLSDAFMKRQGRVSHCSRAIFAEEGETISWNKTRAMFGLPAISKQ